MARIRKIEITNFRGIQSLTWIPSPGINCLIGPGDSGKSSVLEAIDYCLGTRRNIHFTDADFFRLNVETPITIAVTIGELEDALKNLEAYGMYLRSFDELTGTVEDEPERAVETVLSIRLTVSSDLEPSWTLVSERAEANDLSRDLSWSDRLKLAPTRIDAVAHYHLGWRRGSALNRVSEERVDAASALATAARYARAAFGDHAQDQLGETLEIVADTAKELGIPTGDTIKALLDAHSVSFSEGTISLHDEGGVPLRGLGIGSTRLLVAGLQRKAAAHSTIMVIDEIEHGLEPHRIIRLLGSLGAKESTSSVQVFMTTHSPVALRELSGSQLFVTRASADKHSVIIVGTENDVQSTIRKYPEAFLARSIIVCEGASEVGFIRGIDQYRTENGKDAITAHGAALVDCGGGHADGFYSRATAFLSLGYRASVFRDDDKRPTPEVESDFVSNGGKHFVWRSQRALEDELFLSLSDAGVYDLLGRAIDLHGEELIDNHIKSASQNDMDLSAVHAERFQGISQHSRAILGEASRTRRAGWFKSVTWMEDAARDIVGPDLDDSEDGFRELVERIFAWASNAGQ